MKNKMVVRILNVVIITTYNLWMMIRPDGE